MPCAPLFQKKASSTRPARSSGDAQTVRLSGLHDRILSKIIEDKFDKAIMNNVHRGDYLECMVAFALEPDWHLTWDWAPWDCEHTSGARLQIKQSAARQSWDRQEVSQRRHPSFDISYKKGYWPKDGSRWIESPGRLADIYVFAWHPGRHRGRADHRDHEQWHFFAVAEKDLPNREMIGLSALEKLISPCLFGDLKEAVETVCPPRHDLKNEREATGSAR